MRIDKFLKRSRLCKRRSVAKKLCKNDKVLYGDKLKPLKPSYDIKEGDEITIYIYNKKIVFKIDKIPETKSISKQKARKLYTILQEEHFEI
ncbi:MAG TPA: S4 domain-containing protein [Candidatus Mcinerneyibacterium sp.]|nr:S4 domain-containing protein [Candidatus Mcinerneyibacterium sp.]